MPYKRPEDSGSGSAAAGQGAFIGAVHRMWRGSTVIASNWWRGALSSDRAARQQSAAEAAGSRAATRTAPRWRRARKPARDYGIDAVAIVTPNHLHARGRHRVSSKPASMWWRDKPLAISLAEGEALSELAREKNRLLCADAHLLRLSVRCVTHAR